MMNCLAQGGSTSPISFVSVTRPLLRILRKQNVTVFLFVNDSLICGQTVAILRRNVQLTLDLFERAGFLINYKKSQLQPTQQMEFLGFSIDSVAYTISLTSEKRTKIHRCVSEILSHPHRPITICRLASIIGKVVATFPCSEEAPLHYRVLDRFKIKCLRENNFKWNKTIVLTKACLQELTWWQRNIRSDVMMKSLQTVDVSAHVYSDSSQHSFGGHYLRHSISSRFSEKQANLSINTKELLAIYYTLSAFAKYLNGLNVLHFCDNSVACFCLFNKGSSDPLRDSITRKIFALAKANNFTVQSCWLSTTQNSWADRLSRLVQNPRTEFTIPDDILKPAIRYLVAWTPEIDLFASFLNHKFPLYCSWKNDPFAVRCNAFLLNWSHYRCFIHSPYNLVDRALKQVQDQKVQRCLILAPLFHTAHWLPKLMEMCHQPPLLLPPDTAKKLYLPWDRSIKHPLARHMRLILADICSTCSLTTEDQKEPLGILQTMCGERVRCGDMPLPRGVGSLSVKRKKLTNMI